MNDNDARDKAAREYRQSYDLVQNEVRANGEKVDSWDDDWRHEHPEDFCWSRDVSKMYIKAGEHGFKSGWDAKAAHDAAKVQKLVEFEREK